MFITEQDEQMISISCFPISMHRSLVTVPLNQSGSGWPQAASPACFYSAPASLTCRTCKTSQTHDYCYSHTNQCWQNGKEWLSNCGWVKFTLIWLEGRQETNKLFFPLCQRISWLDKHLKSVCKSDSCWDSKSGSSLLNKIGWYPWPGKNKSLDHNPPAETLWDEFQVVISSHELGEAGQFAHTWWNSVKIQFVGVYVQLLQFGQLADGRLDRDTSKIETSGINYTAGTESITINIWSTLLLTNNKCFEIKKWHSNPMLSKGRFT